MKKEAKNLFSKGIDSLILSIELFNRPHDRARIHGVLIFLDHAMEMLLKGSILQRGGRIREKRAKQTIGFDTCVRRGLSDEKIKFMSKEQALTLQSLCMLVITLCCMFVSSCRTVDSECDKRYVARGQPYFWLYQYSPYEYWYQYGWLNPETDFYGWLKPETDFNTFDVDWMRYEERIQLLEMTSARLESTVEKLDRENEALKANLEQQSDWSDFWKRLTTILMKELNDVEAG